MGCMEWVGRPGILLPWAQDSPDRPVVRAETRFPGFPLQVDAEKGELENQHVATFGISTLPNLGS